MLRFRLLSALFLIALSIGKLHAQAPGTGLYAFGSFDSRGFDTINLGSLNIHFNIPVVNKGGRGLSFYYNLNYDNSFWYLSTVNGTRVWTPGVNFGWGGDTQNLTGYITYSTL